MDVKLNLKLWQPTTGLKFIVSEVILIAYINTYSMMKVTDEILEKC